MDQKPLDYLRCVVERITYQSDGYSVLKCAAKGYNDLIAVVGMMPDTHVGSVLTVGGHWKIDSKYGRQFEVVTFPYCICSMRKFNRCDGPPWKKSCK